MDDASLLEEAKRRSTRWLRLDDIKEYQTES